MSSDADANAYSSGPSVDLPLPAEYRACGEIGVAIYCAIFVYSLVWYVRSARYRDILTRLFCISTLWCAVLEVPRYGCLLVQSSYVSIPAYCLHLVSNIPLFIAFSCVIMQWSRVLHLASLAKDLVSVPALFSSNVVFASLDLLAVLFCSRSTSLLAFFDSAFFEAYSFISTLRVLLYSAVLAICGISVLCRLRNWSSSSIGTGLIQDPLLAKSSQRAIVRLTSALIIVTLCFLCRIILLVLKVVIVHGMSEQHITTPYFSLFGILWFLLADWTPRAVPVVVFLYLMGSGPDKEGDNLKNCEHQSDFDTLGAANEGSYSSRAEEENLQLSVHSEDSIHRMLQ